MGVVWERSFVFFDLFRLVFLLFCFLVVLWCFFGFCFLGLFFGGLGFAIGFLFHKSAI